MDDTPQKHRDLIMGAIAGQAAIAAQAAAHTLYEAGGRDVLAGAAQAGLQRTLAGAAAGTVAAAAPSLLAAGAPEAAALLGPGLARRLGGAAAATAGAARGQVLRIAGRAGAAGFLVDAAFGAAHGLGAYRRGAMTGKQALSHVVVEAGTGAAATSIGVLFAAGVVALTGGLAGSAVMALGAGSALAAKAGLRRLLADRPRPAAGPAEIVLPASAAPRTRASA